MKTLKNLLVLLVSITTFIFTSCEKNGAPTPPTRPTAEEFTSVIQNTLNNRIQEFQIEADGNWKSFTSENGTIVAFNTSCLNINQNTVTGPVDVEFIEIFDKGSMLVTNKPTMGIKPNGDKAIMDSGGEIYINLTQNGETVDINCDYQIMVDVNLTGDEDTDMTLWEGEIDQNGNLFWNESTGQIFIEPGTGQYGVFARQFGWNNIDKFINDPRPKTTISVKVPEGYNILNSGVNVSFDGEDTGLAQLDTFDASTAMFSEHYGQIPIGLECHVIFLTIEGNNYKYAIKPVTISANNVITVNESELVSGTEQDLVQLINNLP